MLAAKLATHCIRVRNIVVSKILAFWQTEGESMFHGVLALGKRRQLIDIFIVSELQKVEAMVAMVAQDNICLDVTQVAPAWCSLTA